MGHISTVGSFEENRMAQKIKKSVLVCKKITSLDHQVVEIDEPLLYSLSYQSQQMYLRIDFASVIGPGLFEFIFLKKTTNVVPCCTVKVAVLCTIWKGRTEVL
jgi:hypothetical protein